MNPNLNRGMVTGDFTETYSKKFATNFELALQNSGYQKKYASIVSIVEAEGENAQVVERLEPIEASENNERFADTQFQRSQIENVWLSPDRSSVAVEMASLDRFKNMLGDPMSKQLQGMQMALGRYSTIRMLDAFESPIVCGKDQGTLVSFDTNNTISASEFGDTASDVGLTWLKLINLAQLRDSKELDGQILNIIMPSTASVPLWQIEQLSNMNAVSTATYEDGRVVKIPALGIHIYFETLMDDRKTSQVINSVTYDVWACPAFVGDGIVQGIWGGIDVNVEARDIDRNNNNKALAMQEHNFTMTDINKNFRIEFGIQTS
ncbi:MAG: phage capsid protein [Candidatus Hodarchaeales archaeon]